MAALGAEIFSLGFRFNPKPIEAISYYLPRLIAGAPLHEAVRPVVHHGDVYACEPGELARRFRPLPVTGHRFFFTSCKKGTRVAGPGSWALQSTKDIKDADGNKVGEIKKLRYKKRGVFTDWLMDESSTCGLQEALVAGDRQLVFCKIYVSPKAESDSPAHQESAAFFAPPPVPVVMAQAAAPPPKRPAALVGAEPPCPKRMRRAPVAPSHPVVQPPRPCVPPPPPVTRSSPPASARPPAPAPATRLAMQAPAPPRPLGHPIPMQQKMLPTTTPPVVPVQAPARHCRPQASVQRKQKMLDPFEAMTDEADESSPPALEDDDDWDDLAKCIEDTVPTAEAEEELMSDHEMDQHIFLLLNQTVMVPKEEIP